MHFFFLILGQSLPLNLFPYTLSVRTEEKQKIGREPRNMFAWSIFHCGYAVNKDVQIKLVATQQILLTAFNWIPVVHSFHKLRYVARFKPLGDFLQKERCNASTCSQFKPVFKFVNSNLKSPDLQLECTLHCLCACVCQHARLLVF